MTLAEKDSIGIIVDINLILTVFKSQGLVKKSRKFSKYKFFGN
jgi:hypothetical protein